MIKAKEVMTRDSHRLTDIIDLKVIHKVIVFIRYSKEVTPSISVPGMLNGIFFSVLLSFVIPFVYLFLCCSSCKNGVIVFRSLS